MPVAELPSRIEPCLLAHWPKQVGELAVELTAASAALGNRLSPRTAASLRDLVSIMNCYYSNLIEGHDTLPADIERALAGRLDEGGTRDLQLEARAHIRLQAEIDKRFEQQLLHEPASRSFLQWLHQSFFTEASTRMLTIRTASGEELVMQPGQFRTLPAHDVVVGRHIPPSSAAVERFMAHFEERYVYARMSPGERIVNMAAAHHRLNYIHPFLDGNGRVSRLMSHAMGLLANIGAHGLWSISRGLARGLKARSEYKDMLDLADSPRLHDNDGRGNLSTRCLEEFTVWFLRVALDQVQFMTSLFDLGTLAERLQKYVVESLGLDASAWAIVDQVLLRGHVARGEAQALTGRAERTARNLVRRLLDEQLLASETPKGDLYLRFTSKTADVVFPRLFPASG